MSTLSDIQENELTLREAKSILTKLLLNYSSSNPVFITLNTNGEERKFQLVPKHTRKQPNGLAYAIKEISYQELEEITETGVYIARENLGISLQSISDCYYGLFINLEKERDLRYFNNKASCLKWLEKKLHILEK